MPSPRELNKRVSVQACTQGKSASGGNTKAWAEVATVWAKVWNASGNERSATSHGGEVAEARTEFTIRYRDGIDDTMRISYNSKYYDITHVNNLAEAGRWLILTCTTGVNDG